MPKYLVSYKWTMIDEVEVEADTADEAGNIVYERPREEDRGKYVEWSFDIFDIKKVEEE